MIAPGGTVGLAEWIVDGTYVLYPYGIEEKAGNLANAQIGSNLFATSTNVGGRNVKSENVSLSGNFISEEFHPTSKQRG